jgi:Hypoxia induced protein conserved region
MNTFLIILLIIAVIATVVALVRGIIAFLQTTEASLKSEADGKEAMLKQNKMMVNRVIFQALAVLIVVILLAVSRG